MVLVCFLGLCLLIMNIQFSTIWSFYLFLRQLDICDITPWKMWYELVIWKIDIVVWLCIIFYKTWLVKSDVVTFLTYSFNTIGVVINGRSLEFFFLNFATIDAKCQLAKIFQRNHGKKFYNLWKLNIAKFQLALFNFITNLPRLVCYDIEIK